MPLLCGSFIERIIDLSVRLQLFSAFFGSKIPRVSKEFLREEKRIGSILLCF